MQTTRREFNFKSLCTLALLFGASLYATGCDVTTEILDWAPIGLAALNGILVMLSGGGIAVPALLVTAIKAGFADVIADIQAWKASPPKGTLATIDKVLSLLLQNLQDLLTSLAIPDAQLLDTIVGLASLILTTISGFLTKLPANATLPNSHKRMALPVRIMNRDVDTNALYRKPRAFKVEWNALAKNYPAAQIPLTLTEKLHLTAE